MKYDHVNDYIASFPDNVQHMLEAIRAAIMKAAPGAEEGISYGMPAYKWNGVLVYFAGYEKHIGFYAVPSAHEKFKQELSGLKRGKGSVQFPLDQPMPLELVSRIVAFRMEENRKKSLEKRK